MRALNTLAIGAAFALAGGCATTPLPQLPAGDVPDAWERGTNETDTWPEADWWNNFSSDELGDVIALVEARNLNLQSNERNLRLAQLALRDAGLELWPVPVIEFGAARDYTGVKTGDADYSDGGSDTFQLGANFAYTDILSKPAEWQSAKAAFQSSVAIAADTHLNTLGTAASTYFQILLLRDRIVAAEQNVANAEAITKIVQARVDAGTVNRIELLQQQIAVQQERNSLASLRQQELDARAALALLVAESVNDFNVSSSTLENVQIPSVQPGLPSSLLQRRPDIVQAEANLEIARADVDLARNAYWPNLSITGAAGVSSTSVSDLFGDGTTAISATASLAQLLLDNGARSRNVERRRLELETALANYREAVIAAFNDIEVSLGNIELLDSLGAVAAEDLERAEESFRIAEARYREGVADYQTVLISQNQLFSSRNAFLDNKLAQLNARIALYQGLGGGWLSDYQ